MFLLKVDGQYVNLKKWWWQDEIQREEILPILAKEDRSNIQCISKVLGN